jgi:uncharacterized protein YndB with AHSA1/START domain
MMSNERAGERILGSVVAAEGTGNVRIEDRLDANPRDVWSALTDPLKLARWLGEVEGDLRAGGEFRAHFYASGWEGRGRVEVCEPPQRLLALISDEDEPEHPMQVKLTADRDRTIVVWEERGVPVDLLPAYGAGVQIHVEDLAAYFAGRERCEPRARFDELFPAYRELASKAD